MTPDQRQSKLHEAQMLASIIREIAPFQEVKEARDLAKQVLIQTLTQLNTKETT